MNEKDIDKMENTPNILHGASLPTIKQNIDLASFTELTNPNGNRIRAIGSDGKEYVWDLVEINTLLEA